MTAAQPNRPRTALVLSGGGARGAYQAGVLSGLVEAGLLPASGGLDVLVGSSAGALNAGLLAAHAHELDVGSERLVQMWCSIRPQQVFRTDLASLGGISLRWMRDLSFGGLLRRTGATSLLDTAPLRELLAQSIAFDQIDANLERGSLTAVAMPATDLYTADGVVFLDAPPEVELWKRGRWSIERTRIGVEHLMASSAIPVFFPPIEIEGRWFGDGSVRNTAPLSPAINLGAERIIAIGVRQPTAETGQVLRAKAPSIAQVAGALLDAVMLDAIGVDVEHSERVNQSLIAAPGVRRRVLRPDPARRALPDARSGHQPGDDGAGQLPALRRRVLLEARRPGPRGRDAAAAPDRGLPGEAVGRELVARLAPAGR
jgi:NTE family protein